MSLWHSQPSGDKVSATNHRQRQVQKPPINRQRRRYTARRGSACIFYPGSVPHWVLLLPGVGPRVPRVPCRETPGASSRIPLLGELSLSSPLCMIFALKDLPVLSLVLHPICRCLQMFADVCCHSRVSRLKACPEYVAGTKIRGLHPPWAQAQPEKGIHEPDGSTVPRCRLGGMRDCK